MLLAIDVGNTNVVLGVFEGEELVADFRLHTDERSTGDEMGLLIVGLLGSRGITPERITAVVVSNVVPILSRPIEELSQHYFGRPPMMVGPGIRTGMRILYEDPRQVGADRIVNALAAYRRYGGAAILVDLRTATTLDRLSSDRDQLCVA